MKRNYCNSYNANIRERNLNLTKNYLLLRFEGKAEFNQCDTLLTKFFLNCVERIVDYYILVDSETFPTNPTGHPTHDPTGDIVNGIY